MIPSQLQPLANHLWQSTLFAAARGSPDLGTAEESGANALLAVARGFREVSRSLFPAGRCRWPVGHGMPQPPISATVLSYVIRAGEPAILVFQLRGLETAGPPSSLVNWVPALLYAIWAIGFAAVIFSWWRRWRGLRLALRTASPVDLPIGIQAMASPAFAEPGVFGIRRPCPAAAYRCHRSSYAGAVGNDCGTRNVSRPAARQSGYRNSHGCRSSVLVSSPGVVAGSAPDGGTGARLR